MTVFITPYRRLANLREAMDRLIEETGADSAPKERELMLAVDVRAEDEAFTITALVPGLETEDLNIEILNNTVTIRGKFERESGENTKFLTTELPEGRFSRIITLPVPVDASKVEASLKNGVLNLYVPKAEVHRPKAIKVKTV
jgi:HSP20 family protein